MSESGKIFFAVALGAFIGSFLALDVLTLAPWLELAIGMATGGLTGYFAYDFKSTVLAVPKAWKKTKKNFGETRWKLILQALWQGTVFSSGLFVIYFLLGVLSSTAPGAIFDSWLIGGVVMGVLLTLAMGGLIVFITFDTKDCLIEIEWKRFNFVKIYLVYAPLILWKAISWLAKNFIPSLLGALWLIAVTLPCCLGSFVGHFFVLIHSDIRLLCGTDAAIGVAVGCVLGNAPLGAILGGLWGVLNYWVVSVKILKLAPARNGAD